MSETSSPISARVDDGVMLPVSLWPGRELTSSCGIEGPGDVAGDDVRDVGADPECAESAVDTDAESVAEGAGESDRAAELGGRPRPSPFPLPPPTGELGFDPAADPLLEAALWPETELGGHDGAPVLGIRFPMSSRLSDTRRDPDPANPAVFGSRLGMRFPSIPPRA